MLTAPGAKRHQVNVMLPPRADQTGGLDRHGQRRGTPTTVLANVPAAIEQLQGLELVRAQRIYAEASYRVTLTLYPGHGLTSRHYLLWGTRTLHVGAVLDEDGTSQDVVLLCGEEV